MTLIRLNAETSNIFLVIPVVKKSVGGLHAMHLLRQQIYATNICDKIFYFQTLRFPSPAFGEINSQDNLHTH